MAANYQKTILRINNLHQPCHLCLNSSLNQEILQVPMSLKSNLFSQIKETQPPCLQLSSRLSTINKILYNHQNSCRQWSSKLSLKNFKNYLKMIKNLLKFRERQSTCRRWSFRICKVESMG